MPFQAQLQKIMERDRQFQEAQADRGGQISSVLSDAAQPAAQRVVDKRNAALRSFAAAKESITTPEHRRLAADAKQAAAAFVTAMNRLAIFEDNRASFLQRAGLPAQPHVADTNVARADTHSCRRQIGSRLSPCLSRHARC